MNTITTAQSLQPLLDLAHTWSWCVIAVCTLIIFMSVLRERRYRNK